MSPKFKTTLVWLIAIGLCLLLLELTRSPDLERQSFATFLAHVDAGEVAQVRIDGSEITATGWDGSEYTTNGLVDAAAMQRLAESGAAIEWGAPDHPLRTVLVVGIPLVAILILFVYFLRKGAAGSASNILSLRKSRARLIEDSKVTFADVGGCEDAKRQLGDVIDFLKSPERWTKAGVRLPRGVLLEGPPGCGKTLLARAVAGETNAHFYLVSASEFVEMFVGVGAARVRDMFDVAAKEAPSVIFIDELDAVGRKRGSGIGAAHDEREQTLNQLLVCMDGFEANDRVVVIAATNRADILDGALLRPGRFDRRILIPELSAAQRASVLAIHTRAKKLEGDVSLERLADATAGMSGAQLEALANEAGLLAVRRARESGSDSETVLRHEDFIAAMQPARAVVGRFDRVDALLVESASQLSQATGKAIVRIRVVGGMQIEGELVWADASFIKVQGSDGSGALVPKHGIQSIEALDGTEHASADEISPDRFAGRTPGVA